MRTYALVLVAVVVGAAAMVVGELDDSPGLGGLGLLLIVGAVAAGARRRRQDRSAGSR